MESHLRPTLLKLIMYRNIIDKRNHKNLKELFVYYLGKNWLLGAGRQISSALSHCHSKGVLHLDVKVKCFLCLF